MKSKFQEEINGEFIYLKKVNIEDALDIYNWRSGISGKFLRQPDGYSVKFQEGWIIARGENEINYIIYDKQNHDKVGMIGIYDVNDHDGVANVGRLLLAERFLKQSTPYGLEAMLLAYSYVFNEMNFRKLTGDIMARNDDMVKLQKFLGMKQEGFLSKHTVINGVAEDLHIMSIMKTEFAKYQQKIRFLLKSFKQTFVSDPI